MTVTIILQELTNDRRNRGGENAWIAMTLLITQHRNNLNISFMIHIQK